MEFRQCSIKGRKYVDDNGTLMKAQDNSAVNLELVEQFSVILIVLLFAALSNFI